MGYKRPFTLFLCFIALMYLIFAPFILFSIDRDMLFSGKSEDEMPSWQGVITIWDVPRYTTSGSAFGWLKGRISEFERANPGVFIHLRELNYDNNKEIIFQAVTEGQKDGPDILPLYVEYVPIPLENVEPLDGWMGKSGIIQEEYLAYVSYNNTIYGLPFAATGSVLVINKDLIEQVGYHIPQKDEWTYEEFIEYIEGFDGMVEQSELLTFDAYIGKGDLSIMPILLSDGGQIYQEDQERFSFYQPEMVSGIQKLLNISNKVSTHVEFGLRSKNDVYQDFLENKNTAILAADSSIIYTLERLKNQGEGFPYVIMPFPTGNLEVPVWYSHNIYSYVMMKNDDIEKQRMISKFLEYLLGDESQRSLKSLGKFPVIEGVNDLYNEDGTMKKLYDRGYEHQTHPLHPNWEGIENSIIVSIQRVLSRQKTPTQAYKELQNQLNSQ